MNATCPECGALLPDNETCLSYFHRMLELEWEVAADSIESSGGRGEVAHFYAVSAYVLQHPRSMNYSAAALQGLRQSVADHLAGRVSLNELRNRVRREVNGARRVTRRADEEIVRWHAGSWPITVVDVVSGGVKNYHKRVATWAESVVTLLAATDAFPNVVPSGSVQALPLKTKAKRR